MPIAANNFAHTLNAAANFGGPVNDRGPTMQTALNILGRPLKCDDCGELTPINLLDAVLLDPDGNAASDELYCEKCWPKHKVVPNDRWCDALS